MLLNAQFLNLVAVFKPPSTSLELGLVLRLKKPFTRDELDEVLGKALNRSKSPAGWQEP
ncbi:MAG: hypothetical protein JSW71_11465 [Gemmatimonadota bacterium]|nr:MAG: hypothetical protein JSW71_11465 [Gemmatimonadota bacterium]